MIWHNTLSACMGCLHLTANGEWDPGDTATLEGYDAWHRRNPELHLSCGGRHRYSCTDRSECDCDDLGFDWRACDVCGVNLGGDRYALTAFRRDNA